MKFICKKCNTEKNIYKVKFILIDKNLVCKDAYCCKKYMNQVLTEDYKGMPEIQRPASDMNHSSLDGDKLWKNAKNKIKNG